MVREDQEVDTGRPRSRAEDGDPLWVAAEVADVLVEPPQRLDLVQQAVVPLGRLVAGTQEACDGGEDKDIGTFTTPQEILPARHRRQQVICSSLSFQLAVFISSIYHSK